MELELPIRVAVIGYGLSAKVFHIPFIQALSNYYRLYGIVQRHPTEENNAGKDFPHSKTWTSTSAMFADINVDLVVVSSIPATHFELCKEALEAGKHVICEKPFTPTSQEAHTLAELAQKMGKILTVYQNRRWDADFISLKKLVNDGILGPIAEIETNFDRHRPYPPIGDKVSWKAVKQPGVGAIFDLGTHLLDQVLCLFGAPDRVTGLIYNQRKYPAGSIGEDAGGDSFTVLLHYEKNNHMLVTAKAGVVSPEVRQLRFWVRGEKGSFKKYDLDVQEDQLRAGLRPGANSFGIEPPENHGLLTVVSSDGLLASQPLLPLDPPLTYVKYYELVAEAIVGKGKNPVTAEEAADVIRLIELCIASSDSGETLPWK